MPAHLVSGAGRNNGVSAPADQPGLHIIVCVEQGVLESQSRLLVASVERWLSSTSNHIHVYSPRPGHWPAATTRAFLQQHGVNWVSEPLNDAFHEYPIANKVLACRHFEQQHPEAERVMFIDTDTVFLNPIDPQWLLAEQQILVRPVDNKGPGSESAADPNNAFWEQVFGLFNLPLPAADMTTTVRPHTIRPYYNAGLVWNNGVAGFFQQWYADFMALVDSGLRPAGYQSRDGDDYRCLDQVALAVTCSRWHDQVSCLPATYNYPIPFKPMLDLRPGSPAIDQLVHVHYHKWFQHPRFLDHVVRDSEHHSTQKKWLTQQLPIEPAIDGPFKC